eukprot:m.786824 g.786824  ORF g.786824 m.786824 type:complete len:117 (-) comp23306_c0_seq13:1724-2074(-)
MLRWCTHAWQCAVLPSGAKVPPKAEPVYSKVDKKGVPVAVILSVANTAAAGGGVPEMMTENAMPTRRPHVPRPGTQSMGESSGSDPGIAHYIACSTMLRKRCVARRCTYYAYSVVE